MSKPGCKHQQNQSSFTKIYINDVRCPVCRDWVNPKYLIAQPEVAVGC